MESLTAESMPTPGETQPLYMCMHGALYTRSSIEVAGLPSSMLNWQGSVVCMQLPAWHTSTILKFHDNIS